MGPINCKITLTKGKKMRKRNSEEEERRRREKKLVLLLVFIVAILDAIGPFGSNVFKTPDRYK